MPHQNNNTLYSEDVQEIISHKPGILITRGLGFFFIILCLIVVVSWFIQYPDIVTTKAKLTSINAPKEVVTKISGKLVRLFAKEGEETIGGSVLGYIESTANHNEVIELSANIDTLQFFINNNEIGQSLNFLNLSYQHLGELQQSQQIFQQSFLNFRNYISGGFYLDKKTMLRKDLSYLQKMHSNLLQQKELNVQDLQLSEKTFNAHESLKKDKVISDLDYRNEKSKFINKKLTLPQITSAIISNEAQQNEKLKEIAELENTIKQQKNIFIQSLSTFKSKIEEWKKSYLLTAPITGKIVFASFFQENQQLYSNQVVCYLNPENTQYYAEIYIPQTNFGKVKTLQDVLLKFPSYPFPEYGCIKGKIDFISSIPTDSGYLAKVILTDGLKTNHQKYIQYREGLIADGEIITHNMRLLEKFYYSILGK